MLLIPRADRFFFYHLSLDAARGGGCVLEIPSPLFPWPVTTITSPPPLPLCSRVSYPILLFLIIQTLLGIHEKRASVRPPWSESPSAAPPPPPTAKRMSHPARFRLEPRSGRKLFASRNVSLTFNMSVTQTCGHQQPRTLPTTWHEPGCLHIPSSVTSLHAPHYHLPAGTNVCFMETGL